MSRPTSIPASPPAPFGSQPRSGSSTSATGPHGPAESMTRTAGSARGTAGSRSATPVVAIRCTVVSRRISPSTRPNPGSPKASGRKTRSASASMSVPDANPRSKSRKGRRDGELEQRPTVADAQPFLAIVVDEGRNRPRRVFRAELTREERETIRTATDQEPTAERTALRRVDARHHDQVFRQELQTTTAGHASVADACGRRRCLVIGWLDAPAVERLQEGVEKGVASWTGPSQRNRQLQLHRVDGAAATHGAHRTVRIADSTEELQEVVRMRRGIPAADRDGEATHRRRSLQRPETARHEISGHGRRPFTDRDDTGTALPHADPDVAHGLGDVPSVDDEHESPATGRDHVAEQGREQLRKPLRPGAHLTHPIQVELIAIHVLVEDCRRPEPPGELASDRTRVKVVDLVLPRMARIVAPPPCGATSRIGACPYCTVIHGGNRVGHGARAYPRVVRDVMSNSSSGYRGRSLTGSARNR